MSHWICALIVVALVVAIVVCVRRSKESYSGPSFGANAWLDDIERKRREKMVNLPKVCIGNNCTLYPKNVESLCIGSDCSLYPRQ